MLWKKDLSIHVTHSNCQWQHECKQCVENLGLYIPDRIESHNPPMTAEKGQERALK